MKLHLPCRLRAAVLALFASAVVSSPAFAADPVYWGKINEITSDSGIATSVTLTGLGAFNGAFHYEKLANADLQNTDWTMTVSGTGFNTPSENANETFPATFIGFTGGDTFPFTSYDNPTADTLTQGFILGFGYGSGDKTLYFGSEAGWEELGKVKQYTKEDLTYEVTLTYVGGKFSIESLTINDEAFNLPNSVKDLALHMPAADKVFTGTWSPGCLTAVTANNGTSEITLLSPTGAEAWQVQGSVNLSQWAVFSEFEGANGLIANLTNSDLVHFVGNNGRIVLDEAYIAGANPDEYTLGNKLSAGVDIADLKGGCSFGFEAAAGATLIIADGATAASTDADGNKIDASGVFTYMSKGAGLRITGDGNIVINCATGNDRTETMGATTIAGANKLTIANDSNDIAMGDIAAANATIEATGTGALIIANTKGVNINKLIAKEVTIAKGGAVQDLDVDNLTIEGGAFQAGNDNLILTGLNIGKEATVTIKKDVTVVNATIEGVLNSTNGVTYASNGNFTVKGTANVKTLEAGYENVSVDGGKLNAKTIDAYSLSVTNGTVAADEVTTPALTNDTATLTLTNSATLAGGVNISGTSIVAGSIDGAQIDIKAPAQASLARTAANPDVILATNELTNGGISIDGTNIISDITKATSVIVTGTTTTVDTVEADMVETSSGHTIVANEIEADTAILPNRASYISGTASMTGVRKMNNTAIDADTISGDSVYLTDIAVRNAAVSSADMTLADKLSLSNVDLKDATITTIGGDVTMDKVKFAKNQSVGNTFTTGDSPEVVLTGSTGPSSLNLDYLTINDPNGEMTFVTGSETRYVLVEMGDAATLDYAGLAEGEQTTDHDVVTMNIASYTRSYIVIEGDQIVLYGREDKEGIINELRSTENQAAVMTVLDEVSTSPAGISDEMSTIFNYVGNINLYTAQERQNVVSAASAASVSALAASQRDGIYESQKNLRNRIIQMGGVTTGPESNMDYVGLQAWIQADASFNTVDKDGDAAGYDYDTYGGTVGFNLNASENCIVGAAFSASYGDLTAKAADHGKGTQDAYYLNLFARYQSNRWTHLFIFTAGSNEMELERTVLGMDAKGSTDGYSISGYYEGGYIFSLNEESTQILQPIVTLNLTSAHVNSYKEKGSLGNAAINYDGVDAFYGQIGFGARYQAVIHTTEYERNAVLELRAQVVQNFGDSTDEADVSFLGGGAGFTTHGAEVGSTGFQIGAGVSLPIANRTTLFVDADADFRSGASAIHADIGLRYDF